MGCAAGRWGWGVGRRWWRVPESAAAPPGQERPSRRPRNAPRPLWDGIGDFVLSFTHLSPSAPLSPELSVRANALEEKQFGLGRRRGDKDGAPTRGLGAAGRSRHGPHGGTGGTRTAERLTPHAHRLSRVGAEAERGLESLSLSPPA